MCVNTGCNSCQGDCGCGCNSCSSNDCSNCCEQTCGCELELSAACIRIDGNPLDCIDIQTGASLEDALQSINDILCTLSTGVDGTDGDSAYQVWLNLGNVGTEQDFIDSLKGADGVDGINGTDGADGADGINGINGTNGTNGSDGSDGANGADGQGIDHITFTSSTGNPSNVPNQPGETDTYTQWGDVGETIVMGVYTVYNGADGSIGTQGIQGTQGIPGTDGTDGVDGTDGINGTDGTNGTDGAILALGMLKVTGPVTAWDAYDYTATANASEAITLDPNSLQDTYTTTQYDTFVAPGSFNLATGVWTCPDDGIYDFSFQFQISENGNIDGGGSSQVLERGFYDGECAAGLFIKGPNNTGGPVLPISYNTYEIIGRKVTVMITGARIGYKMLAGEQVVLRSYQITDTDWTKSGTSIKTFEVRRII